MRELALDVPQLMEALVPKFIGYEERLDLASSPPERFISRIVCELPALAKRRSDLDSWLFESSVLVRKEVTMEFTTLRNFLFRTFRSARAYLFKSLARVLSSGESIYCWSSLSSAVLIMAY